MATLNVLLKPASSFCNMRCSYCFYFDEIEGRDVKSFGFMPDTVVHATLQKALDGTYSHVNFLYQGGEPTLCGLDFYKDIVKAQKLYNKHGTIISNSIQSNGYRLDKKLLDFFKENNFLVGISLDGIESTHNKYRSIKGRGTFNEVLDSALYAKSIGLEFNILCVVTQDVIDNLDKIYAFFKSQGFLNLHFIPCLKPQFASYVTDDYSLDSKAYLRFLNTIFDLWYQDVQQGFYVSIRHIDNYLMNLMHGSCESCAMRGVCSIQHVIEGNGNVYPCDFYATDKYLLGNIKDMSFKELENTAVAKNFIQESVAVPQECQDCPVFVYCKNGCKRDRFTDNDGHVRKNMYCAAFKEFFTHNEARIHKALSLLTQGH